ncbi:MAG: hypothetical protein JHD29_01770 [Ilumatobacteraceae bacterium]|nr:hypothetical protein [Ilumatobacteraceae bacterium]
MESLARLVAIIMLSIIGAGIGAFFLGRRKPKNIATKILGSIVGVFAVCSGSWLALLPIGIGARLLGLLVAIAGARQLLKIFRP